LGVTPFVSGITGARGTAAAPASLSAESKPEATADGSGDNSRLPMKILTADSRACTPSSLVRHSADAASTAP
jgi:hypothetical protein